MSVPPATPARWKDLCVDAVDPAVLGPFWAATLDLELRRRDDGMTFLVGPGPEHTVWINQVPEPVTVKQRVHLDVHAGSAEEVLARGATAYDLDSFAWKVLRDPEGGELCVFEHDEVPDSRLCEIVVDAADPQAQAAWWAQAIGGRVGRDAEHGWSWVAEVPGAPFDYLVFMPVAEPKTVKNRVHWDVDVAGPDGLDALVAGGATVLRRPGADTTWSVVADPEGNEFCVFEP